MRFLSKKKSSTKVLAHFNSGSAFFENERFQDARTQFDKVLSLDPNNAPALYLLGRCYYALGEKDLALSFLKESLKKDPNYSAPHYFIGLIHYDKREFQDAVFSFNASLKYSTESSQIINAHLSLAAVYERLDDNTNVVKQYQAILKKDPSQSDVYGYLGGIYFKEGDFEQAVRYLESANQQDLSVQYTLARSLWEYGEKSRATSILQNAIAIYPKEKSLYELLGYYLLTLRRFEETIEISKRAVNLFEDSGEAVYFLARAYQEMGLLNEADEIYRELLKRDPNDVDTLLQIGYVYLKQDKLEKALEMWRQAVEIAPKNLVAKSDFAYGLYLTGNLKAALKEIESVIAAVPDDSVAHQRKGYILQALGHTGAAKDEFVKAHDLGQTLILIDLAELYMEAEDFDRVRDYLEQFLEEAREDKNESVSATEYLEKAEVMLMKLEEISSVET